MKTIDLSQLLCAVLALCSALITTFVVPWLKSRTDAEGLETMSFWVTTAVRAAEQYFGSGEGQAKKQYVQNALAEKGFSVDDGIIESAVNALFGKTAADTEHNSQKGDT